MLYRKRVTGSCFILGLPWWLTALILCLRADLASLISTLLSFVAGWETGKGAPAIASEGAAADVFDEFNSLTREAEVTAI